MNVEQGLDDAFRARARHAAFGGDTKIVNVFARDLDALTCSLRSILAVNEAQIDFCAGCQARNRY